MLSGAMPSGSTRHGRKQPHAKWRWARLESSAQGTSAHKGLVRFMGQQERYGTIKICCIGVDSIDCKLGKAITYDGVF